MFLSNLSIKHPVFATMMMAALAVLGIASYRQLKVDMFPKVEIPVVTVTTIYPGAGPETVEREVTKKIEEEINTVEGVKPHRVDLAGGPLEHRRRVPARGLGDQRLAGRARQDRGDPRRAAARDRGADRPAHRLRHDADPLGGRRRARASRPRPPPTFADKVVKRRLENVRGVGSVALVGESTREIQVVVDRPQLEAYHVSLAEVVTRAAARERRRPGRHRRPRRDRGPGARGRARRARAADIARDPGQAAGRHGRSTCATSRRSSTASRSRRTRPSSTSGRPSPSTSRSSPAPTPWPWPTASSTAVEKLKKELPPGRHPLDHQGRLDASSASRSRT